MKGEVKQKLSLDRRAREIAGRQADSGYVGELRSRTRFGCNKFGDYSLVLFLKRKY